MAWASKYSYEFTSRQGESFEVCIEDESGAPNTVLIPSTIQHTSVRWSANEDDEFSPFAPSEAVIQFHDTAARALMSDVLAATTRSHRVHIKRNGSTYWKGYLKPDEISEPEDWFTNGTISAIDGIGLLENEPYADPSTQALYEGRATVLSVIVDILSRLSLGLEIHVSMNWYPDGVTTNNNPLAHVYVDRAVFRDRGTEKEPDQPVTCFAVLEQLMRRFGLQLCQCEGVWRIIQVPLKRSGLYTVWRYSAAGALIGTYTTSPRTVTVTDEETVRSEAMQGGKRAYDAVQVDYVHGAVGSLVQNPGFEIKKETKVTYVESPGSPGNYERIEEEVVTAPGWEKQGNAYYHSVSEGDFGASLPVIVIEPILQVIGTKLPAPEQLPGPNDYVHQESAVEIGVGADNRITYTSDVYLKLKYDPLQPDYKPPARAYYKPYWVKDQIQLRGASQTYYLNPNGSWSTSPAWLITRITPEQWNHIRLDSDPLPVDGKVYILVGPAYEEKSYTSDIWGPTNWETYGLSVMRDNVRIWPVFADGTVDAEATKTICYVSRKSPSIREVTLMIGDGPTKAHTSYLSLANGNFTRNWGVGGPNNYTLDELLSHAMLKAMRQVRRTHETTYFDLSDPLEYTDTLIRSGTAYAPYSLTRDLQLAAASGLWVRCREDAFAPDYDVTRSAQRAGWFTGAGEGAALIALQQNTSFFGPFARHIGVTREVIPAGVQTQIPIAEMDEALIDAGDLILIVDPNLEVYQVRAAADQNAGDLFLQIEDPDSPGVGYNFPQIVDYPAYLYITGQKLLTIARFGERGFKLSVGIDAIALVGADVEGEVTSIPLEGPLRADVREGTELVIQDVLNRENQYIIARECEQGAMELPIHRQYVKAKRGQAIKLDLATLMTYLYVRPGEIQMGVEEERKGKGITALTADAIGSGITELQIEPLKGRIAEGSILNLTHPKTGIIQHAVVSRDHDAGENILKIHPETLDMPAGTGIDLAGYYIGSQFIMQRDEINMKVSSDQARATWEKSGETKSLTVLTAPANNTTTIQVAPLPEILPAGSKLKLFFYDLVGLSLFRTLDVTTQTEAAKDAQQIVLTAPVTAPQGALVFYTEGQMLVRLRQAEAGIQVLDNQVTQHASTINSIFYELDDIIDDVDDLKGETWLLDNRITSAEGRITVAENEISQRVTKATFNTAMLGGPVGKTRVAYSGNRTSILIDPILEGDTGLAYSLRRGQVVMIVDANGRSASYARLTANVIAGATTLSIEDPKIPGQPAQIYAAAGSTVYGFTAEPEIERTSLNLSLDGIDVEAKLFKSNDWDGTVDSSGKITQVGTRGWCLSGGGDADITGTLHAGQGAITIGNDGQFIKVGTYHSPTATKVRWESEHGTKHLHIYGGFQSAVPMDSMAAIESPSLYLGDPGAGAIIRVDANTRFYRNVGFYGAAPIEKPTVTGTKSGISALASLITQLANLGLITDNTT